jgi:hypothetical protein
MVAKKGSIKAEKYGGLEVKHSAIYEKKSGRRQDSHFKVFCKAESNW